MVGKQQICPAELIGRNIKLKKLGARTIHAKVVQRIKGARDA